ncbi:hypothetical protein NEP61_10415, partial [Escherichia coli]|nr:hypothetical protein [Escherichia coli]MDI1104936.1 hypothetical protein [Escherichia coli]
DTNKCDILHDGLSRMENTLSAYAHRVGVTISLKPHYGNVAATRSNNQAVKPGTRFMRYGQTIRHDKKASQAILQIIFVRLR